MRVPLCGRVLSQHNRVGLVQTFPSGRIAQEDFVGYVNSGLFKGDVNIISGAHGSADGTFSADMAMYMDDVATFGNMPGVKVHNFQK
ncbi:hypothetical protein PEC18_09135 [Paucibacter sp. O1-1]|nr:hypothetical protein [Paucibacter sp. O1-1]MDA3826018.1 hypothetical protein [Paucibacter sp. O1-1]